MDLTSKLIEVKIKVKKICAEVEEMKQMKQDLKDLQIFKNMIIREKFD